MKCLSLVVLLASAMTAAAATPLVGRWVMRSPDLAIDAEFKADGTYSRVMQTAQGRDVVRGAYSIEGTRLSLRPENDMAAELNARFPDERTVELVDDDGNGFRLQRLEPPATAKPAPAPATDRTPAPSTPTAGKTGTGTGFRLSFLVDPVQAAFYLLIPDGWKTEGGMTFSGVPGNKVDMLEGNIKFRVTSPDGKSFFGWYPRFFFCDPRVYAMSSGGILNVPVGSMMDGAWMYPYMTIPEYARTIVFGRFAGGEFADPRLTGDVTPVPDLCKLAPSGARNVQGGSVDFTCTVRGVKSRGRLYVVLYELGSGLWSQAVTAGLVAPAERWDGDLRLMEACMRTFRFNPQYLAAATKGAIARGEKMTDLTRRLNAEQMQFERERLLKSGASQEEFYKVLTDQIETRDPETGKQKWLPRFDRAFTDGQGHYYLTDEPGTVPVQNDPAWKQLKIINRNAE